MDRAVIFDVDGVLLDLTAPEESAFFRAFEQLHGITGLSSDWDSYRVRNDEHIIAEILERRMQRTNDRRIERRATAAMRAAARAAEPMNATPAVTRPTVAATADGRRRRTRRSYATG